MELMRENGEWGVGEWGTVAWSDLNCLSDGCFCTAVSGHQNDYKCIEQRKWAEASVMVSEEGMEEW